MKKKFLYILLTVIVVAILFLVYIGNRGGAPLLNERISFQKREKIPYGTFVAYENLRHLFPDAKIMSDPNRPGNWDILSPYAKRQALIVVAPFFHPDEEDMANLFEFVKNGNDVFVSAMKVSFPVEKLLKCDVYYPFNLTNNWFFNDRDTLTVSLKIPKDSAQQTFTYPGKQHDFRFYKYDTLTSDVLGYDENGEANFIRLSTGGGHFYLHLAPMTFTNYFLLHKNNMAYYEKALSVIPEHVKLVVWDEYFLKKGNRNDAESNNKSNWLSVFFKERSLRWALMTAMIALLVYVLMEMRRKQRPVPIIHPPKNDSLDFVKTIGRLYHDKGNHWNLSCKMSAYFLEHVRTRYKLSTSEMDEEFVKLLSFKTGHTEGDIQAIVDFIQKLHRVTAVSANDLISFHNKLESFYKTA